MYPRLSDLINDLFGIYIPLPIQTYGFFVAMAFILASVILFFEFKRKEKQGLLKPVIKRIKTGEPPKPVEIIGSVLLGFIFGYKIGDAILNYSEFVANPQDFLFSISGSWLFGIAGGVLFGGLRYREMKLAQLPEPVFKDKHIFPHELSWNILLVAAVSGIIGAKLFHILENIPDLLNDPMNILFSFSGLTFFGGLVCGSIAVIIYAGRYNINALHLIDAGAPAIALGYGTGRIGCQLSGDGCWGVANLNPKPDWLSFLPDWMWAYNFPHNVIREGIPMHNCAHDYCRILEHAVYPTSFYEMSLMFIIFGILWALRNKIKIPGVAFSLFLVLVGTERFFIEKIRINNKYHIFSAEITQAEIISSILILLGIAGIVFLYRRYKKAKE